MNALMTQGTKAKMEVSLPDGTKMLLEFPSIVSMDYTTDFGNIPTDDFYGFRSLKYTGLNQTTIKISGEIKTTVIPAKKSPKPKLPPPPTVSGSARRLRKAAKDLAQRTAEFQKLNLKIQAAQADIDRLKNVEKAERENLLKAATR